MEILVASNTLNVNSAMSLNFFLSKGCHLNTIQSSDGSYSWYFDQKERCVVLHSIQNNSKTPEYGT